MPLADGFTTRSRTARPKVVCPGLTVALLIALQEPSSARPCRPNLIPNGAVLSCNNCHSGASFTPFGSLVRTKVTPGSCDEFWGPDLASVDSDGDGKTNGQELGDRDGSWRAGEPAPGDRALVTNPGIREDHACVTISVDPVSGSAPFEVVFRGEFGDCVGDGSQEYSWDFGDGEVGAGAEFAHTYVQAGVYAARLTVTFEGGAAYSGAVTVFATCTGEPVAPWTVTNVGESPWAGCARPLGEGIEIHGGGLGFFRAADEITYAHVPLRGDFSLSARIAHVEWLPGAIGGILVRESTSPDATLYASCVTNRGGIAHPLIASRLTPGSSVRRTTATGVDLEASGVWLRLDRSGDQFTAFTSPDGEAWSEFDTREILDLPDEVLTGLIATGADAAATARMAFDSMAGFDRPAREFLRGDCNDDGAVDISDGVCILTWLFLGGDGPGCVAATNTNGDAREDLSDAVLVLAHLSLGGPAPVTPFPECGPGRLPTDESSCEMAPSNCPQ